MALHKFSVGDRVSLVPGGQSVNVRPGIYTITQAMPDSSQGLQYRVKNVMDPHERVLDEAQLRAADAR